MPARMTANISDFPVSRVLSRIAATFTAAARDKGLHLRMVPSSAWVRSDPILLEQILLNLVSNAVRYTSAGGIVVGCRRVGRPLRIDVCDSGDRHSGGPAAQHLRRVLPGARAGAEQQGRAGAGSRHRRAPVRRAGPPHRRRLDTGQGLALLGLGAAVAARARSTATVRCIRLRDARSVCATSSSS